MSTDVLVAESQPINLCMQGDLIPNSGICAELDGQQIALFYLPNESPQLYALGNWDPIGKANILSRGMVGDLDGRLVVASPMYKQHFDLLTGECLEEAEISVPVFPVSLFGDHVMLCL
ncbi:nitrite reductase small subunit NirD [Porticoccaceae bacterium]|nr:nitrite reductase small subunit NirD [Porticoccaceae bacterium]MDC0588420.1 nitrite reductase small subunit NirD [Porticoccaceae bacterium]MDG1080459.1 nitrite reductase small subunit NirD [Porticoccaceae bacterium]MDG1082116.1 nitrite reductase small subunit NirD [Porticoccaceae bacterium]